MENQTHPALTAAPEDSVSVGVMRERLSVALAIFGGELPEPQRIAFAEAISQPSPVDSIVAAYRALSDAAGDLGAPLLARAIECAEIIAAHSWHGLGDEAAAFAATARANLAAE